MGFDYSANFSNGKVNTSMNRGVDEKKSENIMMRMIFAAFVLMLLTGYGAEPASRAYERAHSANPQANTPRFEDLPATEQFKGKPAAVRLVTREARKYRTVIRDGA